MPGNPANFLTNSLLMRTTLWYYSAAYIVNNEWEVKRAVNQSGGILNRSWLAIPNDSFHDRTTGIEILETPGQIIYWPDFMSEMRRIADSDAALWRSFN